MDRTTIKSDTFEYPYLLVLFSLSIMRNEAGLRCVDALWAKDLLEHVRYLEDLTIIARCSTVKPSADAVVIDGNALFDQVKFVEVPEPSSTLHMLRLLPSTASEIWREMSRAKIVHSSVGSWPIPEAWIITPLSVFRKRLHLIIVESAFWRASPNDKSLVRKIRANIYEYLNKKCLELADLSIFTHQGYMQSLLRENQERGHVISASWIDAGNIISPDKLTSKLEEAKTSSNQPLKLVFAGRLTPDKGVDLLVSAVADLVLTGHKLMLSIYGDGELKPTIENLIQTRQVGDAIRLCGVLSYGEPFFQAISEGDIVVVPSVTDEQPRIVYDAYSQGIPVLASKTKGLIECVEDGKTGWLVEPKNPEALRDRLLKIIENRDAASQMGFACLSTAQSLTHREMHAKRLVLLKALVSNK